MIAVKYVIAATVLPYLLFLALLLYCAKEKQEHYLKAKMTCSSLFLISGAAFGMSASSFSHFLFMLPALICCFLGDYYIGIFRKTKKTRHFMIGLILFLLAHLGFILFVLRWHPDISWWNLLFPICFGVVFFALQKICRLKMKKLKWPALVYCLVLSFFMIQAQTFAFSEKTIGAVLIGVGAFLFFLSDLSICFLYFINYRTPGAKLAVHYFNLITYYVSVYVLEIGMACLQDRV